MAAKNSYQSNYMARRAELFGIIRSNPKFGTLAFHNKIKGTYCNIGWVLKVNGYTDEQIINMSYGEGVDIVARLYNLRFSTVEKVLKLGDNARNFTVNVNAVRAYLVNKNAERAFSISLS